MNKSERRVIFRHPRGQGRAYAVVSAILHASGVKMRSPGPKKKG